MITHLSLKLGSYIARKAESTVNIDAIVYGSEIFIRSTIKILIVSLLSTYIGIFYETWTIIIFSALLRSFSGGIHCSSYTNCLLTSTIVFSMLGLFAKNLIPFLSLSIIIAFLIISTLILLIICFLWIPAGSENKPLNNCANKTKFKFFSLSLIIMHLIVSLSTLLFFRSPDVLAFFFASTIGLLWQGYSVTPVGYYTINQFDRLLKITKGGVQKYV